MQKKSGNNDIFVGILCVLGCEILFGLSFVFTRSVTDDAAPLELLGWRFFSAFVIMSLLSAVGLFKISLKGKKLKKLLLPALLCPVIYYIGETVGVNNTSASESGVFIACIPVASMIASTVYLKKKPSKFQAAGIVITLIGVVITVVAAGISASLSLIGYLFLTIGVVSFAIYSVLIEEMTGFSGTEITYVTLSAGMIVFVLVAIVQAALKGDVIHLVSLPMQNPSFLTTILYQSVGCSILGFLMQNIALAKLGVNRSASFVGVSTIVTITAGVVFLKESFSLLQIVGAIVILGGIYLANANLKSK